MLFEMDRTKSSLRSDFLEYIKLYLIYYKKYFFAGRSKIKIPLEKELN
jgi:hypothetical protein